MQRSGLGFLGRLAKKEKAYGEADRFCKRKRKEPKVKEKILVPCPMSLSCPPIIPLMDKGLWTMDRDLGLRTKNFFLIYFYGQRQ